jgi:acyl carrier protein
MNNQAIQEAVCEVLGVALDQGQPVDPGFCREEQAAWDSLKHIEVIFALEDRFGVQFSEGDMPQMDSVGKITQRVSELL